MRHFLSTPMQISRWLTAGLLAAILSACGGGDSSGVSSSAVSSRGTVVDDQGTPLSGATIKVIAASAGVASASTENDGSFSVALSKSSAGVIRVEKAGFMPMIRAAGDAANNANFAARVVLLPVASTQTFDSTQAAVLRVPGSSARVELAASSLVRTDGQAISGSTTVQLTPIDPSKDIRHMPGVMVDAASGTPIESLGALSVTFTDASGAALNLASGQTATIRIPATPAAGATLPATFPLYHLNETTGLWEQEGTATLQTDPATGDKYYEGMVSHFSTWNADQVMTRSTIDLSAAVGGASCTVPPGTHVIAQGVDYNGITGATGNNLFVRQNSQVRLFLLDRDGFAMDSLDLTSATAGGTVRMPRCLAELAEVSLSGRVTVTSGVLSNYRIRISGDLIKTVSAPIAADGSYSLSVRVNRGTVRARLVSSFDRGSPDTEVTTTVATANANFPDLTVQDTRFTLSGCVQGWADYRQTKATASLFRNGIMVGTPQTVSSTADSFVFENVAFNTSYTLRLTAPDATLAEKSTTLVVGPTPVTLGACLSLPKGPQANLAVSGTGMDRSFSASASIAGDTPIASYAWSFGDGSTATGIAPTHTYSAIGSFTVTLTVTDSLGQKSLPTSTAVVVTNGGTVSTTGDQIALGTTGGCAINSSGGVECWDDTPNNKTAVPNLDSGVTAITAGASHYCAITAGGTLKCWGSNTSGQLGDGTTNTTNTPVIVSGMGSGVQAVSAGPFHTCAITSSGGVKCWGFGSFLGHNSSIHSPVPVDVSGLTNGVIAIAAGGGTTTGHTCALTSGAGVYCWGSGSSGQLGQGSTDSTLTPVAVSGLTDSVTALSAGSTHTCALTASGSVKCWGDNVSGQLGDTTTIQRTTPVNVVGLTGSITAITGHFSHSCALVNGDIQCWGDNRYGQTEQQSLTGPSIIGISTGKYSTCRMLSNRNISCWGWDQASEPGG